MGIGNENGSTRTTKPLTTTASSIAKTSSVEIMRITYLALIGTDELMDCVLLGLADAARRCPPNCFWQTADTQLSPDGQSDEKTVLQARDDTSRRHLSRHCAPPAGCVAHHSLGM